MIKGRILCTDDDEDSREMLSVLLASSGYQVVCSGEPAEALRLAQEQQFDLFLLDNWLPELSGVQTNQTDTRVQYFYANSLLLRSGS
jgi:CheY-like chemotaxis protein